MAGRSWPGSLVACVRFYGDGFARGGEEFLRSFDLEFWSGGVCCYLLEGFLKVLIFPSFFVFSV